MLRKAVVASGRLPDWRTITGADLAAKRANYKAAKEAIKRPIEVFGHGYSRTRGKKYANSIVIDRTTQETGGIGAFGTTQKVPIYDPDTEELTGYNQIHLPKSSLDLLYQIRYFSDNVFDLNLMDNIALALFNTSPYLEVLAVDSWEDSGGRIYTQKGNTLDLTTPDFLEKVLQVTVKDFWLENLTPTATFVPLTTVNFSVYNMFVPGQSMVDLEIELSE